MQRMSLQGARSWAAVARNATAGPLPRPLEGVSLEQLRLRGFPEDPVATVRQNVGVGFTQRRGAVLVDLEQGDMFWRSLTGEDDNSQETVCAVMHHRFAPSRVQVKTIVDGAVDMNTQNFTPAFGLSKGNQDTSLMPTPITIHRKARTAPVIGEYVSSSPRLIDVGGHVVLEQLDSFALVENGFFARPIAQFEGVFEVQHFVQADGVFSIDIPEELPSLEDDGGPIGIEHAENEAPNGSWCELIVGHGQYKQCRVPVTSCQEAFRYYEAESGAI